MTAGELRDKLNLMIRRHGDHPVYMTTNRSEEEGGPVDTEKVIGVHFMKSLPDGEDSDLDVGSAYIVTALERPS